MLRMEVACLFVLIFIAVIYFSAKRKKTYAHTIFSILVIASIINSIFDGVTVYTVNNMDKVSHVINNVAHRIFISSMVTVLYLAFRYMVVLMQENREKKKSLEIIWLVLLIISGVATLCLPLKYKITPEGNYSYGPAVNVVYISISVYIVLSIFMIIKFWKKMNPKKKQAISIALGSQLIVSLYQLINPLALISGLGILMMNLAFFFTVENPDVHLIERLQDEKERADVANSAKTAFIAHVSHEVRTPVNAVIGMTEMILRESKEEEVRGYASDINSSAQIMCSIINDILDLSKIESGKMEIIPAEYEFTELIRDIGNMIKYRAEAKKLDFEQVIDPTIPKKMYGDDVRIRQVLINLLTNAVKYTYEGNVVLKIYPKKKGQNILLHMEVSDTGIGIKEEDLSKLCEEFVRLDEEQNRNIEGTGLGMNITARLLKMMNSELKVESIYGQGTTFSFEIEQEIIDVTPIGDVSEKLKKPNVEYTYSTRLYAPQARVLVVDDNSVNLKVFTNLLKNSKIQVEEAISGKECIEKVCKDRYDIIFLDHLMPELDGIETLHKMKTLANNKCKGVPVIALTANAITDARGMYIKEGFDEFLAKPIVTEKLENMIISMLPKKLLEELPAEISSEAVKEEYSGTAQISELPQIEGIDWSCAYSHMPDKELLIYTVQEFYKMIEPDARDVEAMAENILQDNNMNLYRIKVHAMKSTAALIGAMQLSGMAKFLEMAAKEKNDRIITESTPIFLREWRSYTEKLKVFAPEEITKKPITDKSVIIALLYMINNAADDMDIDELDENMAKLSEYEFPVELKGDIENLGVAVTNFDTQRIEELVKLLMEKFTMVM